jgi:hypothetical protein
LFPSRSGLGLISTPEHGTSTHLSNDSQLIDNGAEGQGSCMFVTYGNNKQHSTVTAAAQRPGEVQRIRDPTLAADVLFYNFIFFCLKFATWLSQITQLHSSNVFITKEARACKDCCS